MIDTSDTVLASSSAFVNPVSKFYHNAHIMYPDHNVGPKQYSRKVKGRVGTDIGQTWHSVLSSYYFILQFMQSKGLLPQNRMEHKKELGSSLCGLFDVSAESGRKNGRKTENGNSRQKTKPPETYISSGF
ncbi:MAG: hypothetical protein HFI90_06865 [Clostridia bacterium]|nr:hypothetical protein [Clostridia bacterium]